MTGIDRKHLKNCALAKNEREKARLQGTPARAVWCYFGKDVRDMEEFCFMGYGLWMADQAARELLCRGKDMDWMHEGIYVCMNPAYRLAFPAAREDCGQEDLCGDGSSFK